MSSTARCTRCPSPRAGVKLVDANAAQRQREHPGDDFALGSFVVNAHGAIGMELGLMARRLEKGAAMWTGCGRNMQWFAAAVAGDQGVGHGALFLWDICSSRHGCAASGQHANCRQQADAAQHHPGDGHSFAALLPSQGDAAQHHRRCREEQHAQGLLFVQLLGRKEPQHRDQPTHQCGHWQPQGAIGGGLRGVGAVRRLHRAALGAADGGFVNLVAAASAVRHGKTSLGWLGGGSLDGCFGQGFARPVPGHRLQGEGVVSETCGAVAAEGRSSVSIRGSRCPGAWRICVVSGPMADGLSGRPGQLPCGAVR